MDIRNLTRLFGTLLLSSLCACGDGPPPASTWPAGDLFPLEDGTRWTWEVSQGGRSWPIVAKKYRGDVRDEGGRKIDYEFVYGRTTGYDHDVTKSIFAVPREGPREFYLDLFYAGLEHKPAVPLLPAAPRVGETWSWSGVLSSGNTELPVSTTLVVAAVEKVQVPAGTFEAVRIEERLDDGQLLITRWLVADVGLVRFEMRGTLGTKKLALTMRLMQHHAAPASSPAPKPH
jgi:hypothetical protein